MQNRVEKQQILM